ncbi:MAG: hypothetical protein CL940_04235 [Deltaproteobacteria bacterium]|nr:hypothetical protein [Deltaproteobacteria bacterium]
MRTTANILGCLILALALSLTAGCGDDGDDGGATGSNPGADVTIPDSTCPADEALACGYDGQCADVGLELATCQVARCIEGCCAAAAAPTFSSCEAQGAGPCEEGACSDSGACIVVTAADGKFCNEELSDACSSYTCSGGNCVASALEICDDNNECTTDSCSVECADGECSASCNHDAVADGSLCNDQNACTGADACSAGVCGGTEDLCECEVNEDCLAKDTDLCDAVGLVCDVENSKCVESATEAVVCDDAEVSTCEEIACEPSSGACVVSQKEEYATCDDGDACTGCAPGVEECNNAHDYCNSNGVCQSGSGTPCACAEDVDCAPFDDGDLCNGSWGCVDGACAELDGAIDCSDQQAPVCHTIACAPESGTCDAFPSAEGEPCDDADDPNGACVAARACSADQVCEVTELVEDGVSCGEAGETCAAGVCATPVEPTLCEQYCDAVTANCADENAITWAADCATDCAGWPEGEDGDTAANTTHCRLYHAGAAADDAALHCPHASPDGGGVCVDPDLCADVTCDAPPAPACEGDTAMTYAAEGTCDGGVCSYATSPVDCTATGQGCSDGQCVDSE